MVLKLVVTLLILLILSAFFYPRMIHGGALVFDDYESDNCPGVRLAIDEFLADKPEHQIVIARYQCAIFKH